MTMLLAGRAWALRGGLAAAFGGLLLSLSAPAQALSDRDDPSPAAAEQRLVMSVQQYNAHAASRARADAIAPSPAERQAFQATVNAYNQRQAQLRASENDLANAFRKHNDTCGVILNNIAGQALAMMCDSDAGKLMERKGELMQQVGMLNAEGEQLKAQAHRFEFSLAGDDPVITDDDTSEKAELKVYNYVVDLTLVCRDPALSAQPPTSALPAPCRRLLDVCTAALRDKSKPCSFATSQDAIQTNQVLGEIMPMVMRAYTPR